MHINSAIKRKPFPTSIIQQAENLSFSLEHYREEVMGITIDADGSRDLDDAIWLEPKGQKALISIHIADPTSFIPIHSQLDQIILERIETLYLKHGNDPMMPHILSQDKISLLEGKLSPTITVEVLIDSDAQISKTSLKLTLLNNLKQYTYNQADNDLNDPSSPFFIFLRNCDAWSQKLNYKRSSTGAIGGTYQAGLYLNEEGLIETIKYRSQQIIQEFMILANGAVANLAEEHKLPIIYRNQIASAIAPGQKTMGEALLSLGIPELMRKKLQSWLNPADYEPYVLGHFALALSSYTHFTSPIRRVADYINHRILKAVIIEQIESPYTLEELTNICKRINKYKLDSKIERDDFFAQKNEHKLQNLTAKNTNFNQFSDKEFSEIIKYSLQKEGIKNIQNEVLTRLKNHLLKPLDYYYLTFFDYQEKENTIGVIMEFLANNSNLVTQSLTIASQLKQSDLEFVEQEFFSEGGGYAVWTIFQNATSLKPGKDKNKTIAKHKACYAWLESYLKKELVDFNQREIEQETLEKESINSPEEVDNPIGILNEFLMKNKLKTPKYDFSAKNGEWECVVIVEDKEGKKIMQTYQANSKKVAKQKATLLVLNELGLIALE